ncbi:aminotransferase class I/II-fold pyridoxal phosphate-dependent enzyme [Actinomadura syzygii]|uniref:Ornithine decarboxylase n=1 Tax=Actinomadura syzygii TaxID=1427538 RepID=A0A5D0UNF3_9ACTN|nr:aminotransferase class I/II-fold pyridoxal phosphate-dependent enzyme [Actinomadura syzygii]TYC18669.1 ornithine decarboxylase [Actinomadura syzygii]
MDHSRAPVLEALAAYHREGQLSFTPPGHKQGRGADPRVREVLGNAVFHSDVLAISGLDDRASGHGVLEHAQELMADAVHAEQTFFSTCGSSLSVKSAMLAVAGPGEELVIARDAHKSVVSGLILSGVRPIWVEPRWDPDRHLAHPPSAEAFAARLDEHPEARGALVTSPTPYGGTADLAAIAAVCHERGRPLIVDEAWGAHLPFHPGLPIWAMDAGADVCVTSVHKMGAGLEQGSVFHQQGDLVHPTELKAREDLLGTTSPSVLLYAGLDGWRRQMVEHGHELLQNALDLAEQVREEISGILGFAVQGRDEFTGPGRAHDLDPLPVVIDIADLGTTGYWAADWLREHHRINLHLADHRRISAQLTFADDEDTVEPLLTALRDLREHVESTGGVGGGAPAGVAVPSPDELRLELVRPPREAFFGDAEQVPAAEAVGRICAEMLTPYPPGIPAVLPGERINASVIEYLRTGVDAGMVIPDAADPTVKTVRVHIEA